MFSARSISRLISRKQLCAHRCHQLITTSTQPINDNSHISTIITQSIHTSASSHSSIDLHQLNYIRRQQLFTLIESLPKSRDNALRKINHKNGFGLRFTRCIWDKYPEPSYYTIVRFKPSQHGHQCKIWGIETFRGESNDKIQLIPGIHKHEWRLVPQPELQYPPQIASDKRIAELLLNFDSTRINDEIIKINVHQLPLVKQKIIQSLISQ